MWVLVGKIDIRFDCFCFEMQFYLQRAESDVSEFLKAFSKVNKRKLHAFVL